jgi:hypothetical protein
MLNTTNIKSLRCHEFFNIFLTLQNYGAFKNFSKESLKFVQKYERKKSFFLPKITKIFYKFITASVNEIFIFMFFFCSPDTYFLFIIHMKMKTHTQPHETLLLPLKNGNFLLYFESYIVHTRTYVY